MPANNLELDHVILRNVITNDEFTRKVIPFLEKDYFSGSYGVLFSHLAKYVAKYNRLPTEESFALELPGVIKDQSALNDCLALLPDLFQKKEENMEWLLEVTEQWCKDRAVYNAIMESLRIYDGSHPTMSADGLPDLLQNALGVSFDNHVGHDYIEDADGRFAFMHEDVARIETDLDIFNRITKGGWPIKTLNILMAGINVGKSLMMCHFAAAALAQGKNVLYITMEMSEEAIAERIDANLFDVELDDLVDLPKQIFDNKINSLKKKTNGKLVIKEYPTGQAHVNHFRALLTELKLKKHFTPDLVFIDYLNICASSKIKHIGGSVNSYTYVKSIAEEVRGFAVEKELPIISATQLNREGFGSSDPGLDDTSESFGLPATADFQLAVVTNEELEEAGQFMCIQLKNRYRNKSLNKRFCIGVNPAKMRLFDLEEDEQTINKSDEEDAPVFDNTDTGQRVSHERFSGLNV